MTIREHKKILLVLFVLSLLLRLMLFFGFTRHGTNAWIYVDSEQYHTLALHLVDGKGFTFDGTMPQYYRLPGYPLFLAWCYKLTNKSVMAALLVQIIITSLIPLLIFLLASILVPKNIFLAKTCAVIALLHLGFMLYAGMLATEALCTVLLLIFFIFFFKHGNWKHLFCAGIALGCASLYRPIGQYVIVLALCMIVLQHRDLYVRVQQALAMIIGWLLMVTPWLIRNYMLVGAPFFHSLPGLHFVQYTVAHIIMQQRHVSYPEARKQALDEWHQVMTTEEYKRHTSLNEYEKCRQGERLAWLYSKKYPFYALKHSVIEIAKTCCGLYSAIILLADGATWPDYGPRVTLWKKMQRFLFPQVKRPFLIVLIYIEIVMMMFMVLGMLLFLGYAITDYQTRMLAMKIIPFCVLLIGLTLAYGGARLRMPADPLLLIAASYGWGRLLTQMFTRCSDDGNYSI